VRNWWAAGVVKPARPAQSNAPQDAAVTPGLPPLPRIAPPVTEPPGQAWDRASEAGLFGDLEPADRTVALGIAQQLGQRGDVSAADIIRTEALFRRYPKDQVVGQLLLSALLAAAENRRSVGDFPTARPLLERAVQVFPADPRAQRAYLSVLVEMRDWPTTETVATMVLQGQPDSPEARQALAYSLAGQGQDREALRAIHAALELVNDNVNEPALRGLSEQIERRLWVSSGCEQSRLPDPARTGEEKQRLEAFLALISSCVGGNVGQRISNFNVAYRRLEGGSTDGVIRLDSPELVGRDVLGLLDRSYAALATALDHRMTHTIPVLVLETEEYQATTGAPLWSGGQYDNDDATITIPTGYFALSVNEEQQAEWCRARKLPDNCWERALCSAIRVDDDSWDRCRSYRLEMLLTHETTHAFLDDMVRGSLPRELNEGLASYMERTVTKNNVSLTLLILSDLQTVARWLFSDDQEGRRRQAAWVDQRLEPMIEHLRSDRTAHVETVLSVYTGGELFVDYLVEQRSMGGIRDLLKGIAESKNLDASFESVFGRGYEGTRRAWLDWLRGKWGVGAPRR
jgi:tetratricopeptide (TPR) repeat protein